ncbi:hypothetical protein ABIC65_000861 [Sphingomonas trueperi]|uniref:hypothetical protein n=1 Tax=Sphingomonas trueperi TaxID=53317 RepID=UPI003390A2B9
MPFMLGVGLYAAFAQEQTAPASSEIVVTGRRPADPDAPLQTIASEEIDTFAAETVGDVITAAQRRVAGGARDVFVNGRRLGDISDISRLPPEAIEKVEILPPSAGARQGFGGGAPVVNVVLKKHFRALQANANGTLATDGGGEAARLEVGHTLLRGDKRLNTTLSGGLQGPLRYQDRFSPAALSEGGVPNGTASLRPSGQQLTLLAGAALPVGRQQLSLSGNGNLNRSARVLEEGRGVLRTNSRGFGGSATLTGVAGHHFWSLLANAATSTFDSGTRGGIGAVDSSSATTTVSISATASGSVVRLPAGSMQYNASGSLGRDRLSQGLDRTGTLASVRRSRDAQLGLSIPLLKRGAGWGRVGDVFIRTQAQFARATGSGAVQGYEQTLGWSPLHGLSAEWSTGNQAVGANRELVPSTIDSDVLVFDPLAQASVRVVQVRGGNPDLRIPKQRRSALRVNYNQRMGGTSYGASIYYTRNRTDDPILTPSPSLLLEQAFPDRFVRVAGTLTRIDVRPLNAFRQSNASLSLAANASGGLRHPQRRGGGAAMGTRWTLNLSYTRRLSERLQLTPGGPVLDLSAAQIGPGAGGRDSFNGQAGVANARFGVQLRADWMSASTVLGQGGARDGTYSQPVLFGLDTNFNLKASADRSGGKPTIRVHLSVENLMNDRPAVVFPDRPTPFALLPANLDPLGRTIRLSVRATLG